MTWYPSIQSISLLFFSIVTGIIFFVYIARLPLLCIPSQHHELVKEYYYSCQSYQYIWMDIGFVIMYLLVPFLLWEFMAWNGIWSRVLLTSTWTACLTFFFMKWFQSSRQTKKFFSRWFHQVGMFSIIYDVLLLSAIVALFSFLGTFCQHGTQQNQSKKHKNKLKY